MMPMIVGMQAAIDDHLQGRTDLFQAIYRTGQERATGGILSRPDGGTDATGAPQRMSAHTSTYDLKQIELALRRSDQRFRARPILARDSLGSGFTTYRITTRPAARGCRGVFRQGLGREDLWPERLHRKTAIGSCAKRRNIRGRGSTITWNIA